MPSNLGSSRQPILLDGSTPVDIVVDFQSRHQGSFTIYGRESEDGDWELLKRAEKDTRMTFSPARIKAGLLCEFLYWSGDKPFRAAVIFDQSNQKQVVDVTAPGTKRFIEKEVMISWRA